MPGSGPINAKLSQPTFEVGFAQAVLLSGMIVKVYTPKIVARDCYGSAVVVDGVAAAVVAVRVVAVVVSFCLRAGVVERPRLLPLGFKARPRLRVTIEVDRLAIDESSTAGLSSYFGLETAEVCTAGVVLGVGLVGLTDRKLFASCFLALARYS